MRNRPLWVLTLVAASMVGWFSLRMWAGDLPWVWRLSCLLGAWAPLGAAGMFLYVRAVGDREDTVFAAWLVRAIGMHFTLAWLVGASDWLRGPPGYTHGWNSDLGAPVVFLSFPPVFAACVGALTWVGSVRARLPREPASVEAAVPAASVPYRGVGELRVTRAATAFPRAALLGSLAGVAAMWLAMAAPWSAPAVIAACAFGLGLAAQSGAGAVVPSVLSLVGVAAALQARQLAHGTAERSVDVAFAWPWVALAAVVAWLAVVELQLRLRARAVPAAA